jgi:hypothetical protein
MSIILAVVLRRQWLVNSPDPRWFLDTSGAHLDKAGVAGAAGESPTAPPTGLNEINELGSKTWNCS